MEESGAVMRPEWERKMMMTDFTLTFDLNAFFRLVLNLKYCWQKPNISLLKSNCPSLDGC